MNQPAPQTLDEAKFLLPCLHTWKFIRNEDGDDAYFQCEQCFKQVPYEPEILGDFE